MLIKPENDHSMTIEALRSGYPDYYNLDVIDDELAANDAKYVRDVFAMYDRIQRALKDAGEEVPEKAKCPGFDGNNESALHGFAIFLLEYGNWAQVQGRGDFPNSHGMQPDYRSMLSIFSAMIEHRDPDELTADEAHVILAAG